MPLDRRARRTRRALNQAILSLLVQKEYEQITVQNITDSADLNRATFYLHYTSKDELLVAALEERFAELEQQIEDIWQGEAGWNDYRDLLLVFEHVAEHAALYKVLLGKQGRAYVVNHIIDYITQSGVRGCREAFGDLSALPVPVELVNRHIAGSLYALVSGWVLDDMPHSAETMARWCHQLCRHGVQPLFEPLEALSPAAS